MTLKPSEAKAFYDRFGKKQDTQAFYETQALDDLTAHASLSQAQEIFEFGCGTGRLAVRLLSEHLPPGAVYIGCDLSETMVALATEKLAVYPERAQVVRCGDAVVFPLADHSIDRVVSTYVLDLLSKNDIRSFFLEAHRVLKTGGKICLVSLTNGTTPLSKIVATVWAWVFRLNASLLGGCRPISLQRCIDQDFWQLEYRNVVVSFGVPSEILIAQAKYAAQQGTTADRRPAARPAHGTGNVDV